MGAIGAAILAQEEITKHPHKSNFYGWNIPDMVFESSGFECKDCPNMCEIIEINKNSKLIARWGSKCGKWDDLTVSRPEIQSKREKRPIKKIEKIITHVQN